jgi:uncharacterized protein YicC (UPF0701 family)
MPILPLQIISVTANGILFIFFIYLLLQLNAREKKLAKKEGKIDTNYHHVVDEALSKERQILDDATHAADQIITGAQYVNQNSKHSVDEALQKMVDDVSGETKDAASNFRTSYQSSLDTIAKQSLNDFQTVTKDLQTDLQTQVQEFHKTLLPALEKELDEYKQARLKQAEQTITRIVQQASQDILKRSISFEDHQKLLAEALEKAKKEGLFN